VGLKQEFSDHRTAARRRAPTPPFASISYQMSVIYADDLLKDAIQRAVGSGICDRENWMGTALLSVHANKQRISSDSAKMLSVHAKNPRVL
jgi:hypothetical protein